MTTTAASALETSVAPLLEAGAAALAEATGLPVEAVLGAPAVDEGGFAAAVSFADAGSGVYVVDPVVLSAIDGAPAAAADEAAEWVKDTVLTPLATGAAGVIASLTGGTATLSPLAPIDPSVAGQDGATTVPFTLTVGGTTVPAVLAFEANLLPLLTGETDSGEATAAAEPSPAPAEPSVQPATLPELGPGTGNGPAKAISMLAAVGVDVTVELGGTRLQMRDLLSLHEGSVVPLDQPAGSAVDVLVNGTVIARGDVVVVDDELGVRITEMVEGL